MTNVLRFGKQAFTWTVVALTVVATMGVAPLAANAQVSCPSLQSGDLFKVPNDSAVFLLDADLNRMYFPTLEVYNSWYEDFSGVQVIDPTCVSAYPTRSNTPIGVNARAGAMLVKETISPVVYAVLPGNQIAAIGSEAVASALYGASWASLVRDVPSSFFANYSNSGMTLTEMRPHNGQFVQEAGSSDVYMIVDGMRHLVDGTPRGDVRTVSAAVMSAAPMGTGSVTAASAYADPTQGATGSSNPSTPSTPSTPVSGAVSVSLSANTPASQTVPRSASRVQYLTFVVTAGAQGATINSIEFERFGLGSSSNFDKLWLEANGAPVSNDQSVNSDDVLTLSPNYVLGANQSVEMTLVANLNNANTANQDGFRISGASMVSANGGTVSGNFPVAGNYITYADYAVATLIIDERGADTEVNVGDENVVVGEFDLEYDSSNNEDGHIDFLRFEQNGTIDMPSLANIALYEDGVMVDARTDIFGDFVTFVFQGAARMFEDGDSRRFEIRGDIAAGDDGETIIFTLDDRRDIAVTEGSSSFGVSSTINLNANSTANYMHTYTVDAGQFTISLDASNPTSESYAAGSQNVVALVSKVDLGQSVQVDGLRVYLSSNSYIPDGDGDSSNTDEVGTDIERAELFINGRSISSVTSISGSGLVSAGGLYFDFSSSFQMADDDLLSVELDFNDTASSSNIYRLMITNTSLAASNFSDAEYVGSGDNVATADFSGTVTGNNVEIIAGALTATRNDGYSDGRVFIAGNQEIRLQSARMSAGTASDIRIQTLNYDLMGLASASTSFFTNLRLEIDGVSVGTSEDASYSATADGSSPGGTVTFTSLNHVVPRNGEVVVELFGTVASGLTDGSTATPTLDVSASTVEDAEGQTVSINSGQSPADVQGARLQFNNNASLSVSVDGDSADPSIIVAGGSTAVDLATFNFEAQDGSVSLTDFYFVNVSSTNSSTVNSSDDARVNTYQLVDESGTVLDSKGPQSGVVSFVLNSGDFTVPADNSAKLTVRGLFNDISQISETGAEYLLSLRGVEGTTLSSGSTLTGVTGVNVGNNNTTYTATQTPRGSLHVAARTVPTLATVALSNTSVSAGQSDIYSFSVTADSNRDVSWKNVVLEYSGLCTNGAGTTYTLGECLDSSMQLEENNNSVAATFTTGTSQINIELTGVETVSAGTTKTYVVSANLSNFAGDNDSLSIFIDDNETGHIVGDYATVSTTDAGTFIWADNAGGSIGQTASAYWFNGYKANGLDTSVFTQN